MWILVAREPRPDAPYWTGRGLLAALDAVIWPVFWIAMIRQIPAPTGVMGPFFTAVAVLAALSRLHRAVWENHRYFFTTWRWGKPLGAVLLMSEVMKLAMNF